MLCCERRRRVHAAAIAASFDERGALGVFRILTRRVAGAADIGS